MLLTTESADCNNTLSDSTDTVTDFIDFSTSFHSTDSGDQSDSTDH